ncbi:hypothetical protein CDD80_7454 [Ophiocordyceps camponoti-rufipedis]|uniref:Uncharacterized protein n=1 Tax=Ophiocordyceps camponoti-rufipedis TaxID=2004952 RepID=A0A2C5XQR0_9HYPO|nr:hypothetical protein CDD80_7454 [Ophiocordyceps camponoti-rufipedis]
MHGLRLMNWAGRISDDRRDESLLLVDVLGLETLVDDLTLGNASATATSILGPMWRANAPIRDNGSPIGFDLPPDAETVFMHGTVTDAESGEPLVDAEVDVWQALTNAHIHLKINAKGHKPLVTQIFDVECPYLEQDVAFAVKEELKVRFVPREGDERAKLELGYDIRLAGEDV